MQATSGSVIPLQAGNVQAFVDRHHEALNAALNTLEAQIADRHPLRRPDYRAFLDAIGRIGGWWGWKPIFTGNIASNDFRQSLAHCHVAARRDGREYLVDTNAGYPVETGRHSLRVLGSLTPEARAVMFFQTPDVSHRVQDSVTMFDDGLITLRIPGTDWRVPLMPECFSDAEGGVTNHEREQLFGLRPDASGQTLDAMYVATRAGLSPERARSLSDWHVKQGDAYAAAHRDTLATSEFVSACEIALNVDDWFRAVTCLERAKQHLVRCEDLEWAETEGACLVDMFDACGLRLTAGEVALVLSHTLQDRHGCASAVSRFGDLARSRYEEAELPVSVTCDPVAVNRGIREVIWHQQDALGAGGLSFLTYLIQMDNARDPISSTVFERHSNQQWQLMDWNESTPGGERIMKLVLSDTISALAPNGRGINPRRNCYFCDGDVMQGQFLLDVLLAATRANRSDEASQIDDLSDGHEESVEDDGLRRRRNR